MRLWGIVKEFPVFYHLALSKIVFRSDGNQHNLRNAAYEALMEMVKNSPKV